MQRDVAPILRDMLRAVAKLKQLRPAAPKLEPFSDQRMIAERALEIISEASRRLPDDMKASQPHIPWRDIAAIGNHLRHG